MYRVVNADCLEYLRTRPAEKIHSVVCDPPYGLSREPDIVEVLTHWLAGDDYQHRGSGFMGKEWDSFVPGPAVWREVFRVLKPGGHALVFAGTRTVDLMTIALRLAGFEIRDGLEWLYGQGMPKSHNVGKAIDRELGHTRERVPSQGGIPSGSNQLVQSAEQNARATTKVSDEPISEEAAQWAGWGTSLKPMREPIIVARKPLEGKLLASGERSTKSTITVAQNMLKHGVGAYNIGDCMIPTDEDLNGGAYSGGGRSGDGMVAGAGRGHGMFKAGGGRMPGQFVQPPGRHPGNVILSHHDLCERIQHDGCHSYLCHPDCPVRMLDAQAPKTGAIAKVTGRQKATTGESGIYGKFGAVEGKFHGDGLAGASRFFYIAKATRKERDAGLEGLAAAFAPTMGTGIGMREHRPDAPGALVKNTHPTVKPIELMRWLCRLVTPPGGVVLDPFMGSGTTGIAALLEGFSFVGIEREQEYAQIAALRIAHWTQGELQPIAMGPGAHLIEPPVAPCLDTDANKLESTVLAIAGANEGAQVHRDAEGAPTGVTVPA